MKRCICLFLFSQIFTGLFLDSLAASLDSVAAGILVFRVEIKDFSFWLIQTSDAIA